MTIKTHSNRDGLFNCQHHPTLCDKLNGPFYKGKNMLELLISPSHIIVKQFYLATFLAVYSFAVRSVCQGLYSVKVYESYHRLFTCCSFSHYPNNADRFWQWPWPWANQSQHYFQARASRKIKPVWFLTNGVAAWRDELLHVFTLRPKQT
jgi:hypothetical protein